MVYVSITGLSLKGPWHMPMFWWHAFRSMTQAQRAPGNLSATARTIDGVHHTLSVWQDQAAMRAFLAAGAHGQAMAAFRGMATGRTIGFAAQTAPDWEQAHRIWLERAREV